MTTLTGNLLLREVPEALHAGISAGKLKIYGSVIRSVSSGRIVGYLQEAAGIAVPAAMLLNPVTAPVGAALLAAKVGHSVLKSAKTVGRIEESTGRLEEGMGRVEAGIGRIEDKLDRVDDGVSKIRSGMDALDRLGIANLALSATGIGISVAGFTVISAKIDGVKRAVLGVADQIETVSLKIDQVRRDYIDADFADLKAIAKSFDEAWQLADAAAERRWQDVAQAALRFQSRFEWRADHLLTGATAAYELVDPLLDAISLSSGLRVAALAACNEKVAAFDAAADGARTIERLTGGIGLADLVRRQLASSGASPGSQEWAIALAAASEGARPTVRKIRSREAASATRAAPLALLDRRGISTRDWMAAARAERDTPVLLMLDEAIDEPSSADD